MKSYIINDGIRYFGYDTVVIDSRGHEDETLLCGIRKNVESLFDSSVKVPDGASLYVMPNCPIPLDDIRRNYNLKRKPDSGDYNVITRVPEAICHFKAYIHVPSKTVYVFTTFKYLYSNDESTRVSTLAARGVNVDECVIVKDQFFMGKLDDCLRMFLDGELTKPSVWVRSLNIKAENSLTLDSLMLAYRLGKQCAYNKDNLEKYKLQLQALNQTDWREYPQTIRLLTIDLMGRSKWITGGFVATHSSSRNKAINDMFSVKFDKPSQKDFEMSRRLLGEILEIKDTMFVSLCDVMEKSAKYGIPISMLERYYGCVVRLKAKDRYDA